MAESPTHEDIEAARREARAVQDQLVLCSDPQQRILLLQQRNKLLAKVRALRRAGPRKT
jgi:hypothetical protein